MFRGEWRSDVVSSFFESSSAQSWHVSLQHDVLMERKVCGHNYSLLRCATWGLDMQKGFQSTSTCTIHHPWNQHELDHTVVF